MKDSGLLVRSWSGGRYAVMSRSRLFNLCMLEVNPADHEDTALAITMLTTRSLPHCCFAGSCAHVSCLTTVTTLQRNFTGCTFGQRKSISDKLPGIKHGGVWGHEIVNLPQALPWKLRGVFWLLAWTLPWHRTSSTSWKPLRHMQTKDPSVFIHSPPWQASAFSWHSSMSATSKFRKLFSWHCL